MLETPRGVLDRLSLRARLVLGVLALAAVGLVAADVATYASLRSFLLDRTDSTLDAEHIARRDALAGAARRLAPAGRPRCPSRPAVCVRGPATSSRLAPTRDDVLAASGASRRCPAPRRPPPRLSARRSPARGRPARRRRPRALLHRAAPSSGGDRYRVRGVDRAGHRVGAGRRDAAARRRQHAPPAAADRAARDTAIVSPRIAAARALDRPARACGRWRRSARPRPRSRPATCRAASSARTSAPRSAGSGSR